MYENWSAVSPCLVLTLGKESRPVSLGGLEIADQKCILALKPSVIYKPTVEFSKISMSLSSAPNSLGYFSTYC